MSTLLHPTRRANRTATPSSVVSAIAWHALLKTADKEAVRDDLEAGETHRIDLAVSGSIDGESFEQSISAILSVGHDSQRASSATPDVNCIVAAILAKLNTATREAILRDLPEQFAAAGCTLPDVPAGITEAATAMLVRLRAKKTTNVRGSVSCKYRLADLAEANEPSLSIVG